MEHESPAHAANLRIVKMPREFSQRVATKHRIRITEHEQFTTRLWHESIKHAGFAAPQFECMQFHTSVWKSPDQFVGAVRSNRSDPIKISNLSPG